MFEEILVFFSSGESIGGDELLFLPLDEDNSGACSSKLVLLNLELKNLLATFSPPYWSFSFVETIYLLFSMIVVDSDIIILRAGGGNRVTSLPSISFIIFKNKFSFPTSGLIFFPLVRF